MRFAARRCGGVRTPRRERGCRIKRFACCSVLLRNDAEGLAGILSPQRLPFRLPRDWQYKSNEPKDLLQYCNSLHRLRWRSGVGWSLCRGVQPLHGCERVLRSEMRISHGHADSLVAEKLFHGANVHSCHYETNVWCRQCQLKFKNFASASTPTSLVRMTFPPWIWVLPEPAYFRKVDTPDKR